MPKAPIVFVHGNPETGAVWQPLLRALGRVDTFRLSPPGFDALLPGRFSATMTAYRDWLTDQLEQFARPVHLIGHDWGGLHVMNVAMHRPDLLSSWVSDAAVVFAPDYDWHPLAQTWQTAGEGEAWVRTAFSAPLHQRVDAVRALLQSSDTPHRDTPVAEVERVAEALAAGQDEDMGRAILLLYRSAAQPAMADAGRALSTAAERPGLVIDAGRDVTTGTASARAEMAANAGARIAHLLGLGHWWMVQDPQQSARALADFWFALT